VETRLAGQRAAQLALLDADRDRLAGAVEDTWDEPLAPQTARLARPEVLTGLDDQLCALTSHSGGGV
jgi:hypothetical protein